MSYIWGSHLIDWVGMAAGYAVLMVMLFHKSWPGWLYRLLRGILNLYAWLYGRGAAHEVCRDLRGDFRLNSLKERDIA